MTIAIKQKAFALKEPTTAKDHIFLVAGEMSGDLLGAELAKSLSRLLPQYPLFGVAGPLMQKEGVGSIGVFDKLQVMGIFDVAKNLPSLVLQFKIVENAILKSQPKAVIFIDYPGFNLRMATRLRKRGYKGKLIQYVCPSVWVWGKDRIPKMAKSLDLLLTLFPFEPACFKDTTLPTFHVGHPLSERFKSYFYDPNWRTRLNIPSDVPLLALFPGSRSHEMKKTFPIQLKAAALWLKKHPETHIAISLIDKKYESLLKSLVEKELKDHLNKVFFVPSHSTYELMREARGALAKSGTITLELAWHQVPTIVLYGVSSFNRLLAKYVFHLDLPHYCIVNILENRTVFPELIKTGFEPENIVKTLEPLWNDGPQREATIQGCSKAWEALLPQSPYTPSEKAVLKIKEVLK